MTSKKINESSKKLRFYIWLYFLVFTVLLIFIIWIMQTVFFESNYRSTRLKTMNAAANEIEAGLENGVNEKIVRELNEAGVQTVILAPPTGYDEIVSKYPDRELTDSEKSIYTGIFNSLSGDEMAADKSDTERNNSMIYIARRVTYNGENCYLILVSSIRSLYDTIVVLRFQLILTACFVLVLSSFLSWIIAGRMSEPIDRMSEVAVRWARGDQTVKFDGKGYREISKLADALNYAKEETERAENLQRDLLANVSHDLKTPLTMIKAYAEMIKDISGDNKEKRDKHTEVILEEADRLTQLVNDILNLSRLQASADINNKKVFNLSDVLENALIRFDGAVSKDGYKIEREIFPDVFVYADENKIEEVIYNLVGNSINYTGENKTVSVYLTTKNDKATLEIIDSGKGISEEQIKTIWEKYYRISDTHHRAVKGTGLGLSIVKAILTAHNLKFGVISKQGKGSNFYVIFDMIDPDNLSQDNAITAETEAKNER